QMPRCCKAFAARFRFSPNLRGRRAEYPIASGSASHWSSDFPRRSRLRPHFSRSLQCESSDSPLPARGFAPTRLRCRLRYSRVTNTPHAVLEEHSPAKPADSLRLSARALRPRVPPPSAPYFREIATLRRDRGRLLSPGKSPDLREFPHLAHIAARRS